jgi:hypothetical protein
VTTDRHLAAVPSAPRRGGNRPVAGATEGSERPATTGGAELPRRAPGAADRAVGNLPEQCPGCGGVVPSAADERAHRRIEAYERALASRAEIDRAKGVLTGAFGLDAEMSFDILVWVSQNANIKLVHVCEKFLEAVSAIEAPRVFREQVTLELYRIIRDAHD